MSTKTYEEFRQAKVKTRISSKNKQTNKPVNNRNRDQIQKGVERERKVIRTQVKQIRVGASNQTNQTIKGKRNRNYEAA